MDLGRRASTLVALVVFLIAATVYMITLTPTVPFWDSGEFIAVSNILGVPHPPGTPLFVLIGRIATLVPWASIAQRVNAVSAISSALAVLFTYLVGLRLVRHALGPDRAPRTEWIAHLGGALAALMLAFSDAYWENSIEAEVYQLMSLAQILVLWLGMRWWEEHEKRPTAGLLLLAVYVMWLSVGLHLGVGIMGLPLLLLVALLDMRMAVLFAMPALSVLLVTMGLERMAGAVLVLSIATLLVYVVQKKLSFLLWGVCALGALYGAGIAFGDSSFDFRSGTIAALSILIPMAALARKHAEGRILLLALALMVVGYSTHLYLPIRAAQHPAVNEGAPATWDNLRDLLERKQYGQMNMFVRRAPLSVQLNKEFWRYFSRQWPVLPVKNPGWASILALSLGVLGAIWEARRDRRGFLVMGMFFGLTTAGMIVFLNFTDHEVRDRDYFFQSGYHAFALWIGVGSAWLVTFVRDAFEEGDARRYATWATAGLLALQPFVLMKNLWFTHDRRGNYVARDYAYNMLEPLAPNSFLFTNGDNDTFPLWYIQQVEGFRKDVRIVNMSLLNTDWYIRQLRDEEPKVPIRLDDATIRLLGGGAVQDSLGRIIYTNEFMVQHIIQVDRRDGGWIKQPYFAVTVPEHVGLDKNFTLEGLVYRVNPDTTGPEIDVAKTVDCLYHRFKYRGLFFADGAWDTTVYKDENSETLSRNYMAAHVQLAYYYRGIRRTQEAIAEMERAQRMFPNLTEVLTPLGIFYLDLGDTTRALRLFERLIERDPGNVEARYYHGLTLVYTHRLDEGVREFQRCTEQQPDFNMPYLAGYYALKQAGRLEGGVAFLERWVDRHPEDAQARELLTHERGNLGRPAPAPLLDRPVGPAEIP